MVVAVRLCSAPGATWAGLSRFTKVVERHLDLGIRCHTVATVRAVGNVKMASGVPVHQDVSGIIDPVAGSLRSDGRCLPIIHLIEDDPASDRELFSQLLDHFLIYEIHACTSSIIRWAASLSMHSFSAPSRMCIGKRNAL